MLLKMSKLTDNKGDDRAYINTRMILVVEAIEGDHDSTLIRFVDKSTAFIKKPVKEVIELLMEYSPDLFQ